ncbi:sigma-70 region 4 domain-containing protein [Massilibacteroides sp.]|uniref:helix-turn-helix transcriptional regulator n=1 Tax=Massilibacteroides sp. TaxID=2034766 RepID=UPI00261C6E79|nr:sigma-70 region 4 domain-containing protein [Massilibacteroides sp.]MDD4516703.1 sigma-70 region 4 domain-containing protein [Massilibacteroides sp.]
MKRATISADIIASSSLSAEELYNLTQFIHDLFEKIKKYQKDNDKEDIKMRLVAGDLIECLLLNPNDALRIVLTLKAGIKSFPIENPVNNDPATEKYRKLLEVHGIRAAIGIGDMDIELAEKNILKGEAINISGRLISEQKTSNKERVTIKNTLFFGSGSEYQNSIFQPILSLLDTIFTKMTRKQSEIILWKLIGYSEQEIAENFGVSQSSVNQHSKNAGWTSIEESLHLFSTFDFQNT